MKAWLQTLAFRGFARTELVPVADCVHYCAFRYGRGEYNPYENYLVARAEGRSSEFVRGRFVDFLRHYRPENFGEALGVELSRSYTLWDYPWEQSLGEDGASASGWMADPTAVPDILTHFSAEGILLSRIEEEFSWLERAFDSIRETGYQPLRHAGHIEARRLLAADGQARYLILDGNHRLSALVALGHATVPIRFAPWRSVRESTLSKWPGVQAGVYTEADARRVYRAYFEGNQQPRTTTVPAPLLPSPIVVR